MKDLKYLFALTIPLSAFIGLYVKGGWLFLTPVYAFVFIPIIEHLMPVSSKNLSEETKEKRAVNRFFDWMLYANAPIVFGLLIWGFNVVSTVNLSTIELTGLVISIGMVLTTNGINVAHELGHRQESIERFLSKALLLPCLYMHFYIEHNHNHHLNAATKEDPATARYGQTLYSFWITSTVRQYFGAWKVQMKLLKNNNRSFFSLYNDVFWYVIIQFAYLLCVYLIFGALGLGLAIATGVVSFLFLETVNYIEHYGLLRLKNASGRYERVQKIHSWNSNHVIGRIILYELTRHSDHHYKSSKKYQVLESHEESPILPYGYPTSMVLAMIPPLWFGIMNKRVPADMI
ncbi:alkane 1-monooxygenase [Flavobacteriaceae bacterium]|jgi:alkane 1-monooxygenase|nr:alkane 1-monooxygenase [Flavobacteriaceae bacterium]|tara:strand:+ start:852 stop:1889 length:1038 start_codon:yes stop_codon:yes gene_type:complete